MAKTGQEIVKEQLGELTFQLCVMDAERLLLKEANEGLTTQLIDAKAEIARLQHELEIVVAVPSRPQIQPAPQPGHPGNVVRNPDKPEVKAVPKGELDGVSR